MEQRESTCAEKKESIRRRVFQFFGCFDSDYPVEVLEVDLSFEEALKYFRKGFIIDRESKITHAENGWGCSFGKSKNSCEGFSVEEINSNDWIVLCATRLKIYDKFTLQEALQNSSAVNGTIKIPSSKKTFSLSDPGEKEITLTLNDLFSKNWSVWK